MPSLAYRTYAKLNLSLEVLHRRDDGYHEIASLSQTIGVFDVLEFEPSSAVRTIAEGLDVAHDANLVTRAIRALQEATGATGGAEVTLHKGIPIAAGLGGGSSDAATTLVALNRLWRTHVSPRALAQVAASLGSDIPFFLRGGAAIMRGRGEMIEPVPTDWRPWFVVVAPQHALATKTGALYGALEGADFSDGSTTQRAARNLLQGALSETDLRNVFTRAARAVFPGLEDLWCEAERLAGARFHLTGAGPSMFCLAGDRTHARKLLARLRPLGVQVLAARATANARSNVRISYP